MPENERLAVIKNIGFGCRDCGIPCLYFKAYISETEGALQVLSGKEMMDFVTKARVYNITHLEGKPVWVTMPDPHTIHAIRPWGGCDA